MAAKKPKEPDRLKITIPWEEAAAKLARTPAGAVPPRVVKPRKKKAKG